MPVTIDLRQPPQERWLLNQDASEGLRELADYYLNDLGVDDEYLAEMTDQMLALIPREYLDELRGIAQQTGLSLDRLMAFNLYYDLTIMVLGCTAFAAQTDEGILHGRNLDWFSANKALSRHSQCTEFINGPQGPFTTVGWPGGVSVLSGVAKDRFAITLNAVISDDPKNPNGQSVAFLLRDVLQHASCFAEAVERLSTQPIVCDCLLLVSGIQDQQAVVIERTPMRSAQRWMTDGLLAVTNNYETLQSSADTRLAGNDLVATSCGRNDRIIELLQQNLPQNSAACFNHLSDPQVMMQITEQQMVFNAHSYASAWRAVK